MKIRGRKFYGIFYNGEYNGYTCKGRASEDNAWLEFKRRKNLIMLAKNNKEAFEQIIANNVNLYHGTNFNALLGIIENCGMLSENELHLRGRPPLTGEEYSRNTGYIRSFISFTDQIQTALEYSKRSPSEDTTLESFGIIIGISADELEELETFFPPSEMSELGVSDMLPISKIKIIFVPNEKVEIVKNMIGDTKIKVTSLDTLPQSVEKVQYNKEDIRALANTRSESGITKIFKWLKELLTKRTKQGEKGR